MVGWRLTLPCPRQQQLQLFADSVLTDELLEPAGSDTFVTTSLGGKDVVARMRADASALPGEHFDFAVNMDKAVAFDPATEERIP